MISAAHSFELCERLNALPRSMGVERVCWMEESESAFGDEQIKATTTELVRI